MPDQPRILILGDAGLAGSAWLSHCFPNQEPIAAASWVEGLERIGREKFDLILSDPADAHVLDAVHRLLESRRVLAALPDGIALVRGDRVIRWANPAFEAWCGGKAVGRDFFEALGAPERGVCPFGLALKAPRGTTTTSRLQFSDNRHLEVQITPVHEVGAEPLLVAVSRDVTALVQHQQKLDALYKAGRALAALAPEQLAEMSVEERIELLKLNIRKFTHDVLHYDVIEIRLLDRRTNQLVPLLQEGMTAEAAGRALAPADAGQGVTGHVAATGKTYVCDDTAADPLYVCGAAGARSSLTVALTYQDQVVGTCNVESPLPNAFNESDRQFLELFGNEVAAALHTLELLSAEKHSAATQSIEAISREVALPVDDILAATASLLDRYIGHEPEMADKLRKILTGARSIKACIQQVGENIAPPPPSSSPALSSATAPPPALKGLRVLVADSDERVRRSAHGLLGRWGCVVETARDAHEAITMARLGNYDAILADIRLPDMDGYQVYHQLRADQPQARVVLMTGYGYDPTHALVKARQEGLLYVLFKPFRVDQLLNVLTGQNDIARPRSPETLQGRPHSSLLATPTS